MNSISWELVHMHLLRPHPDLLNENLPFIRVSRRPPCKFKLEKRWPRTAGLKVRFPYQQQQHPRICEKCKLAGLVLGLSKPLIEPSRWV